MPISKKGQEFFPFPVGKSTKLTTLGFRSISGLICPCARNHLWVEVHFGVQKWAAEEAGLAGHARLGHRRAGHDGDPGADLREAPQTQTRDRGAPPLPTLRTFPRAVVDHAVYPTTVILLGISTLRRLCCPVTLDFERLRCPVVFCFPFCLGKGAPLNSTNKKQMPIAFSHGHWAFSEW